MAMAGHAVAPAGRVGIADQLAPESALMTTSPTLVPLLRLRPEAYQSVPPESSCTPKLPVVAMGTQADAYAQVALPLGRRKTG